MRTIIFALILIPMLSLGENYHLKGFVIDKTSNSPLEGAIVYWDNTEVAAISDDKGHFEIDKMDSFNVLVIDYTGYQTQKLEIINQHEIVVKLQQSNTINTVEISVEKPASTISMYQNIKSETLGRKELAKAACCNLSESFETNPTVDVSYTDAITGTKQIQLLGLSGPYSLITSGNIPTLTGNSSVLGMEFIPGQWLNSIQLIKGTGSVVNGYSSIAGQINTEYIQPNSEDKLFLNVYGNSGTRLEINAIAKIKSSTDLNSRLFLQADNGFNEIDNNNDGFMDNQLGPKVVLMNTWQYSSDSSNWESISGVKLDFTDKTSGQLTNTPSKYQVRNKQNKLELWSKIGYVSKQKQGRSTGLQIHFFTDQKDLKFGNNPLKSNEDKIYLNWIYADILKTTTHSIKTGLTYSYNSLNNSFNQLQYQWTENVVGSFLEYTFKPTEKFSLVSGLRYDYSTIWNSIITPRIHGRWKISNNNVIRFSGGIGTKNPNPFLDNIGVFASSRNIVLPNNLKQEVAWNYGVNYTRKFNLFQKPATLSFDYYRTDFKNKLVTDLDLNPNEVNYYFVQYGSYANSFMSQFKFSPIENIKFNLAYRLYDVQTQLTSKGLIENALTPKHRAFINGEMIIKKNWFIDITYNWNGKNRIPANEYSSSSWSDSFSILNAQLRYKPNHNWDYYVGGENILNYQQANPIINSDLPFNQGFDASLIWAPVFGTKIYFGIKYLI